MRRTAIATFAVWAIAAGVAYGDATIYATAPNEFFQGDVTIAQGDAVTFKNVDTVDHDVTAERKDAEGKPLFASGQVTTGGSAPVAGVEYLTTGSYSYICSIHPFMKGTITVSSEGTPKPRPGGGSGGGGGTTSAPAGDTTAPALSLKVLDTKRSQVRKRRSLQLSLGTSEAATVTISAHAGGKVVATGTAKFTMAGTRKVTAKLTKAGLAMTKKSKSVAITVTADGKDAAGNAATASASGRLR